MNRAYDFATIGFRPYTETEEFVTIGAVAVATRSEEFGYILLPSRNTRRINAMFPGAKFIYSAARKHLESELAAIRRALNGKERRGDMPHFPGFRDKEGIFSTITSSREGVICFPVRGRRLATDLDEVLATLRKRFIERHLRTNGKPQNFSHSGPP